MSTPKPTAHARRSRIGVGLVDDDPNFRLYLEAMLGASARHRVVATAGSAGEAADWAAEPRVDVALVDIGLPDRPGPQVAGELLVKFPGVLVIMLTAQAEEGVVLESIRAGAVGYILKGAREAEILAAINDALAGGAPMAPVIARKVLGLMRSAPVAKPAGAGETAGLTPRELEVVELVAGGASDKEVAERLGLAISTVKNALLNIYGKWRVRSRTEAAVKFLRVQGG